MALINCPECENEVSEEAEACPNCGHPIKQDEKEKDEEGSNSMGCGKGCGVFLVGAIVIVIIAGIIGSAVEDPDSDTSTQSSSTKTDNPYTWMHEESKKYSSSSNSNDQDEELREKKPEWDYFTSEDEMSGEVQAFSTSPKVTSNRSMDFPYRGVKAWLGFGCDKKDEWAYIGFTEQPNLTNTEAKSGGYSSFSTRIKWDDDVERTSMSQEWGSDALHFQDDESAIRKFIGSHEAMVELNWHGEGRVHFEFTLNGSADGIKNARKKCI